MNTIEIMDCGEIDCEYCSKDKCIYMTDNKAERNDNVLDKIRAEIEQIAKDYDKFDDYRRIHGLWIALDIIDKYKSESEGKDADSSN